MQCLDGTSYPAINRNTNFYQKQRYNPRHQRHQYTVLADENFSTEQTERMSAH